MTATTAWMGQHRNYYFFSPGQVSRRISLATWLLFILGAVEQGTASSVSKPLTSLGNRVLRAAARVKQQRAAALLHADEQIDGVSGTFLQISDVHLDAWYNESLSRQCFCSNMPAATPGLSKSDVATCSASSTGNRFGQHGCDTPLALLQSTFEAAAAKAPPGGYDWVFITGDLVRHRMLQLPAEARPAEVRRIMQITLDLLGQHFPSATVHHGLGHDIFTTGNADFPGNYNVSVTDPTREDNPWFASLTPLLFHQSGDGRVSHDASSLLGGDKKNTFARGGYFAERLTDSLYVVSLNTVIYSRQQRSDDPFDQFQWLRTFLQGLRARALNATSASAVPRALILGHIPPVVNNFHFQEQWQELYSKLYWEIISQYADLIAGQLFAHLHTPLFRLLPQQGFLTPLFVAGSVSPVYENNPSFRVWRYEGSHLLDYTDYFGHLRSDGPQDVFSFDKQFSACKMFNLSSLAVSEWRSRVYDRMGSDDSIWRRYMMSSHVTTESGPQFEAALTSRNFRDKTVCSVGFVHYDQFQRCLAEKGGSPRSRAGITGFFWLASVAGFAMDLFTGRA